MFAILLHDPLQTTSPFIDASRLQEYSPRLAADQVSNTQNTFRRSSRRWTASVFPSFDALFLSIFFSSLSQLVLLRVLRWNSIFSRQKRKLSCWLSSRGATGDRSFAAAGPHLRNSLPTNLRQMTSYGQFMRHLKSHLFRVFQKSQRILTIILCATEVHVHVFTYLHSDINLTKIELMSVFVTK